MKALPAHPALYQIDTRVWLTELSRARGLYLDVPAWSYQVFEVNAG